MVNLNFYLICRKTDHFKNTPTVSEQSNGMERGSAWEPKTGTTSLGWVEMPTWVQGNDMDLSAQPSALTHTVMFNDKEHQLIIAAVASSRHKELFQHEP